MKKEYTNGKTTIIWQSDICIHCGNCAKGLPEVFKPREKPWIQMGQVDDQIIIDQVNKCPSKAISIKH